MEVRFGSMAADRDVPAYVCCTPEQRTSVCEPELGRNVHQRTCECTSEWLKNLTFD
jgi:hypothetical protein